MNKTVLFVANRGYALTSSRKAIIKSFIEGGWKVVLATADDDEAHSLVALGASLDPVVFNRGGFSARSDWVSWRRMLAVFRRWQPSLAHLFHAKPVMLGPIAARKILGQDVRIVNTITGLGHAFGTGGPSSRLAGLGYRVALPRSDVVIFQNKDDRALFIKNGWTSDGQARLIPGSGVDLKRFSFVDRHARNTSPVIVMLGRLLRQKGIPEFVEVARRIRLKWAEARFLLAGEEDSVHPDALTAQWVREQVDIEYLGRLDDVRPLLSEADLLLFTSYYREGVPRVVMEAAAAGLPTVGFDVPGVREAVRDGETGYLVSDRDLDALSARVAELLCNDTLRLSMGRSARALAERAFDIEAIQAMYWDVYRELGVEL